MRLKLLTALLLTSCCNQEPTYQEIDLDANPPVVEVAPVVLNLPEEKEPEPGPWDHKLGTYSTKFKTQGANESRAHNIAHATAKLGSIVLQPGEEFSFNKLVGIRSESNGFKAAHVIYQGVVEDGIGGGVCQVSSTLNGAIYHAGLLPSFRKGHSRPSEYIMAGLDATVTWPDVCESHPNDPNICYKVDYRVKNTFDYPIGIKAAIEDEQEEEATLRFTVFGQKPQTKAIEVVSYSRDVNDFKVRYRRGEAIAPDEKRRIQKGDKGKITTLRVRTTKDDTTTTDYYQSLYRPVDEVWEVGAHYPLPKEESWESSSSAPTSSNPSNDSESTPPEKSTGTPPTTPPIPQETTQSM